MQIFAAIELKDGKCAFFNQGDSDAEPWYDEDPVVVAETWDAIGTDWLHIVNLDGAFGDREKSARNVDTLQAILDRVNTPIQFGGGVRSLDDVERTLNMGVSRVIIGSMAADRPRQMLDILGQYGPEQIALGLDVKLGKIATHGWRQMADISVFDLVQTIRTAGLRHVIYTDIAQESLLSGNMLESAIALAEAGHSAKNAGQRFKVIVSGGVTDLSDVKRVKAGEDKGLEGLIIGNALYTGAVDLSDAMHIAHN